MKNFTNSLIYFSYISVVKSNFKCCCPNMGWYVGLSKGWILLWVPTCPALSNSTLLFRIDSTINKIERLVSCKFSNGKLILCPQCVSLLNIAWHPVTCSYLQIKNNATQPYLGGEGGWPPQLPPILDWTLGPGLLPLNIMNIEISR